MTLEMNRIPIFAAAFLLLCSCAGRTAAIDPSEWMTALPDSTPGCEISIPGAHDACTAGVDDEYSYLRTQVFDISGLWDAGVRSFDLRPAARGDRMGIFHDKADTHVSFEEVIATLADKLEEHPGEFAVVIFRHEQEADSTANWSELMGAFLRSEAVREVAIGFRPDLTLGELRGHILFLGRQRYADGPVGGYISGWDDCPVFDPEVKAGIIGEDGAISPLYVQDHYAPQGREDKLEAVLSTFEGTRGVSVWTVNHTSAYASNPFSYGRNARNVNSEVAERIASAEGHAGILVTDFAGVDSFEGFEVCGKKLVDAVIAKNF